jgi:hypothetical protein
MLLDYYYESAVLSYTESCTLAFFNRSLIIACLLGTH